MHDFEFCKVTSWSWNTYDGAFFRKWLMNENRWLFYQKVQIFLLGTEFASVFCFVYLFSAILPKP